MSTEDGPVFVEKQTYRQRRLVDAARLLPVIGVVLVCLPLLWINGREEAAPTAWVMIYLFTVWLVLTVVSGGISRHLGSAENKGRAGGAE